VRAACQTRAAREVHADACRFVSPRSRSLVHRLEVTALRSACKKQDVNAAAKAVLKTAKELG